MGDYGRYGYLDETQGRLVCHECGRSFRSLIGHISRKHSMAAEEYREVHGLARTLPLIAEAVRVRLHDSGVQRRDSDPRVLAALTGAKAEAQRAAAFPRAAEPSRTSTRLATSASKTVAAEAALAARLVEHGWSSLSEAVAWAEGHQVTWHGLAQILGVSATPLTRRGRKQGLDLPTIYSGAPTTIAMLDAARAHVAAHGTLRGVGGDLGHWLAVRRNLRRRTSIETELDQIDPDWSTPQRAPNKPTDVMLTFAREYVAEHGTLRGTTGALSRWITGTRYAAARAKSPSKLHQELDAIDPEWRNPR